MRYFITDYIYNKANKSYIGLCKLEQNNLIEEKTLYHLFNNNLEILKNLDIVKKIHQKENIYLELTEEQYNKTFQESKGYQTQVPILSFKNDDIYVDNKKLEKLNE